MTEPGRETPRLVVIEPGRTGLAAAVRELLEYAELVWYLTWRDVKVRYKQSFFGAAWAVLQPVLLMIVFTIFLGRLAGVPSDGQPYAVFSFAALVPWTLFSQSLTAAANSVVQSSDIMTKVYFPRLVLPVSAAGSFLLDFVIATVVLIVVAAGYGLLPSVKLLVIPALVVLTLLASLAVGTWAAAVNVRYRDVRYALPFIMQVWLFASPVAYPSSLVPARFQALYGLNPMAGVIEAFRWAFLGTPPPSLALLAVSTSMILVLLVAGVRYFLRTEREFADVI